MTAITLNAGTLRRERPVATTHITEFLAGAREGLEIEARYHALSRKSTPDLAKMGLTRGDIPQVALCGKKG